MKASELRSGNYVQGEPFNCARIGYSDGVVSLTAYGIGMIEQDQKFADHYQPIPLTIDLLERLGATKRGEITWVLIIGSYRSFELIMDVDHFRAHLTTTIGGDISLRKMRYLHELQNAYFALIGEELSLGPNQ